ncbi:RNA processing exonuclease, beta-lactamase fold, Cft2 family [Actinoplanes philippinensis]|uniref:RNA processing exonuclease, beta-lactamase fold, Cft2 family n=1 Tax=Actinoplanes philippinensis TaxID=35752 RepID=A0A1I2A5H8_9ACTN|nr:RNA processing exonuclease, beta-lactamase fold, Cft2 family [Actinoplanes philippinensis]
MRQQRRTGDKPHRASSRRSGGGDQLNQVLLAAAETLNEWRSLHPRRRPGRAVSWLVPSWPSGLLLSRYGQRLAEGLVADRVLREHARARVGLSLLTQDDRTTLFELSQAAAVSMSGDSDDDISGSGHSERAVASMSRQLIARALLDPNDATAATGASLFRRLPVGSTGMPSQQNSEPSGAGVTAGLQSESAAAPRAGQGRLPRQRQDSDSRELRRLVGTSAKELTRARAELSSAQAEVEALKATLVRLTQERDQARANLPSRQQRQRLENAIQLAADLRKARKQLSDLREERVAQKRAHSAQVGELEDAVAAAQAERDKATDARHRLEDRLGDLPGRAHYLQNLLKGRISRLEADLEDLPRNQARTRLAREVTQLRELSEHLDRVLPATGVDSDPQIGTGAAQVATHEAAGAQSVDRAEYRPVAYASADRGLRVEVLGGGHEIGGSAVLVEAGSTRILVDAGVRPNADSPRLAAPPRIARAQEGRLDAVVVTHGHNDHAGFVPKVIADQPRAATICTPATAALMPEMWADAKRVMEQQANDMAEYGWLAPLYGEPEVEAAEKSLRPLTYGRPHNIKDLTIQLFDAGHILGAAGVVITAGDQRAVITGDIYNLPQLSVGSAQLPPKLAREADLLVIESTYCDRRHRDRALQIQDFVRAIAEVVGGGGRVLIPAFGLGRAQEVALMLRQQLPDVPVLVDGLARAISDIYEREAHLDIFGGNVQRVDNRQRSRLMQTFQTGVVITTSGMLTGGFAVPWAQQILPDPHSALFVCGYQDEESAGRALQRLAERDDPTVPATLPLQTQDGPVAVPVAARVETYSLSAHADRDGLTEIIDELAPARTMLVHGLGREQKKFRETLERARGRRTVRNDLPWSGLA